MKLTRSLSWENTIYGLPLDELVGTPPIGDPRIHISPRKFHDQTILPFSRGAIGVQAF